MISAKSEYRYLLDVDVPATDVLVVLDALDGEQLELSRRLGASEVRRQLDNFRLQVDYTTPDRLVLERDIEILSTYLAAPVSATEIAIDKTHDPPALQAWRVLGRNGEVVRIELDVAWTDDGTVDIAGANQDTLAEQMPALPGWAQSLLALRMAPVAVAV